MKQIMEQYGDAIITVVAILACCVVVAAIIKSGATSSAFQSLIDGFFNQAKGVAGM